MEQNTLNGLLGGLGGAVKAIFGAIKAKRETDYFEFNWKMTSMTVIEGAVGGIVLGYAIPNPVMAFFGGMGINELADINDLIFPKPSR